MSRIEDQARYYRNIPLRDRSIKAVVHVEDTDDRAFWENQLQNVSSGNYHFIFHSRNEKGKDSTGCEQCLKYRPYLNSKFFICIDSDLRLLRSEEDLKAGRYIAQTYTYSWENHYCEGSFLQERFMEKTGGCDFDFKEFLKSLSEIVFHPLLLLIHYSTPELNTLWNIRKFNQCIPLQPTRSELADNGLLYLHRVENLFEEATATLLLPPGFSREGLSPENAYLHIQGHQLYNLLRSIGSRICKGKGIAFTSEILDTSRQTSGYAEIDNVQADLNMILRPQS